MYYCPVGCVDLQSLLYCYSSSKAHTANIFITPASCLSLSFFILSILWQVRMYVFLSLCPSEISPTPLPPKKNCHIIIFFLFHQMVTVSLENHVICYVLNCNQNNCKKLNFSVCKYLGLNKLSKFGSECGFRHGEIGDNRINEQLTTA